MSGTAVSADQIVATHLAVPEGFRSTVVANLAAALEDQHRQLVRETRGLTVEDLGWQPAPGMSSIGMLLAHIPVANLHILHVGALARPTSDVPGVIGVTVDDDGMPLPPDGAPPPGLAGKDLAYFDGLLERAQAHVREQLRTIGDADLERRIERPQPDGSLRVLDPRWAIYHMLEHIAGHRGQIALLKHLRASLQRS